MLGLKLRRYALPLIINKHKFTSRNETRSLVRSQGTMYLSYLSVVLLLKRLTNCEVDKDEKIDLDWTHLEKKGNF